MSRIRVALLATTVEFGGIERVLLTLLRHMETEVDLVPVLFTRTDVAEQSFFERLRDLGIAHNTIYVNTSRLKYFNPLRNIAEAMALFRRQQFDLIHSHGYRADLIGLVVARRFGLPVVATCHGFIGNDLHLNFYNRLDVFLLRYFTRVIAVSASMKKHLAAGGVGASKIDVVTNAVEGAAESEIERDRREVRRRLAVAADDFLFGFVGRLSEEKGVHNLLEAAGRLVSANRRCRFLIVGDGAQKSALEQQARQLGLENHVTLVGFQSDPSRWYPAMDAFVLPSMTEGTPMALLEAMAHRLPVIATEVGGVPAVVADDVTGLLVPPADPQRLFEAMQSLNADRRLQVRLADAALRSIQDTYDVQTWVRKVRDVYRRTLEGDRSAG